MPPAMALPAASDPGLGSLTSRDTQARLPRATRVKNKAPAPVQIAAEHLLREARELRGLEHSRAPARKIADAEELAERRLMERKFFEHSVASAGASVSAWAKYAQWEERQGDLARARSVFERALAASAPASRDPLLWAKYAEFEMRTGCVGHARNVWDRAVALLPRADQVWRKYVQMEKTLGAVANARQVFDRWMAWRPGAAAWWSYAGFELRYGGVDRARTVYERFVAEYPRADAFMRYAGFEEKRGKVDRARQVYERAVDLLADDEEESGTLLVAFGEFEEEFHEVERARAIYKYALDRVPNRRAEQIHGKLLALEKQFGDPKGIKELIRLEESVGDK